MKQLKDEFEYRRLVELLREIDQDRLDALAVHLDGNNMDENIHLCTMPRVLQKAFIDFLKNSSSRVTLAAL